MTIEENLIEALEIALKELKRIKRGNDSHAEDCVSMLAITLAENVLQDAYKRKES